VAPPGILHHIYLPYDLFDSHHHRRCLNDGVRVETEESLEEYRFQNTTVSLLIPKIRQRSPDSLMVEIRGFGMEKLKIAMKQFKKRGR
jgi:tRNA(Ile2) C34 agmatinyltransferase TiaS